MVFVILFDPPKVLFCTSVFCNDGYLLFSYRCNSHTTSFQRSSSRGMFPHVRPHCNSIERKLILPQADEEVELPPPPPGLALKISTSFPHSEIFGIKLVNGHPTKALLEITNDEPEPVGLSFIGGNLWTTNLNPQGRPQILRNLTTARYNVEIPAGQTDSISYDFVTDLHPQDLRLSLAAVVTDNEGTPYTLQAFNETVSVVEADTSIFDPQV